MSGSRRGLPRRGSWLPNRAHSTCRAFYELEPLDQIPPERVQVVAVGVQKPAV